MLCFRLQAFLVVQKCYKDFAFICNLVVKAIDQDWYTSNTFSTSAACSAKMPIFFHASCEAYTFSYIRYIYIYISNGILI